MMESGGRGSGDYLAGPLDWRSLEPVQGAGESPGGEITAPGSAGYEEEARAYEGTGTEFDAEPYPPAHAHELHLNWQLTQEIRAETAGLPPRHPEAPELGVDYTNAPVAYAVDTILLHVPETEPGAPGTVTADTEILLVQRASGDGTVGSWSGVQGFVDKPADPGHYQSDDVYDPVAETVRTELYEECNVRPSELDQIELMLGDRFTEERRNGGTLHVLPLVGRWAAADKPRIIADGNELADHQWVPLGQVLQQPDLSPGFATDTLPRALRGLGLSETQITALLQPVQ